MLPSQTLLDSLSLLAVVTDADGRVIATNDKIQEMGRAVTEGLADAVFAPDALPAPFEAMRTPRAARGRFSTAINLGLGHRVVEWRPSVLEGGVGTLYLGLDVTRERETWRELKSLAKTAAEASEAKMRFLATMSHEMRTPLNGILGMTGLLLDTPLDPNQTAYAEAVRESGSALLALINDILDYSKIEAGHLDLDDHPFDLHGLVQSVAELLSPRAANKGLEIASTVAPDVPARLRGDEGRLRQVLLNLAGNGVKFTEDGGVTIEVTSRPLADGRAALSFAVRDTGIGIAEDAQASVFEEFAQADETRARKYEGTGLGLAIVRRIVGAMGGDVRLESTLGQGSVFSFTVPLAVEAGPVATAPVPETVVLATDSAVLRRSLGLQLKGLGCETVVFADTAEAASEALRRNKNAVLLCDLPIAAAAGQRLAGLAGHALVLLSPLARGRLDTFKRAGFSGYLIKPVRQASLAERLVKRSEMAAPAPEHRLDAAPAPASPDGAKRRVLLAEDNQINAVLATAIIRRAGHHVDVAGNGQEAIETLAQAPYDVVLMDMHMPVMDGLEATRRIRAEGGEAARLPIVALTANAMRADRETCLEAGMDDFLSKPFDPADLIAKIEDWAAREGREGGAADADAAGAA